MMTNITKQYKMNKFDPSINSNKVWIGMAFEDGSFETRFGRVRDGANLASKRKTLPSATEAEYELEKKRNEKLRKGYRDTGTFEGETVIKTAAATDLKQIATKQIAGAEDATTAELIKYLAEVNIHHITHSTSISYNSANATFSTPLGVLSPETVKDARNLLNQISKFNSASGYSASRRESVIKDYFQLVPKDFGVKIPPVRELLASDKQIQSESAILDALEASINSAAPQTEDEKMFSCKLVKVPHWTEEGKNLFRRVRSLYDSTKNANHHQTNSLKLTRLYEVEIAGVKAKFDAAAATLGNVRRDLWHGTRASNLLSILRGGLIIPPSSASHCTGRMFGNGIYTSLQSTKALNYATDFWNRSGMKGQKTFMFLCEVALGKSHNPKSSGGAFPAKGTNSTWVEAGTAGVMNHECIVYDTAQINLCYLAEFGG